MKNISVFQTAGKGVFRCGCCGRDTRETNPDHGALDLCAECYELAGIENTFSDHGSKPEQVDPYRQTVRRLVARVERLGGSTAVWRELLAIVNTEAEPEQKEMQMKKTTKARTKKGLSAADRKFNRGIDADVRRCERQIADIDKDLATKSNWDSK